ncbi:phospholipase D family protein [Acinetobacter wuhouensis]|uniref:Phospholipase D family protein n=1 Tax=Acinetobacter wuhouensis TaxID=1879050 RepID=A0A385C8A0_9GAMM|nr:MULTISPECIES: phospholipase D family protein [Acinetobacter]AXQ23323.1 phospholipase D family protein [Acinetobacter wuhouensis]AYO55421.1 phospholipase D family protein [Acinetobacter wuhouensis]RZG46593.1 phospholipase D family protein [Acinetobacter wuhouensis]RZG72349.1 phospholipase D family protein [Acinetobacter wuhouensis]RZG87217.1 phospholipase D family protein [Acinetobacter sp. WCHAc060033]
MQRTINRNTQLQQKHDNQPAKSWLIVISSCLFLSLSACSTLPKQETIKPEYAFDTDTQDTDLAKIITPLKSQNPELTGYHVLYDPLEAIAARINLIEKAEKTLDLQYYIWDNDKIGSLALYKIIEAADRGVKVRLLIDDNNAGKMEGVYLALDQHANIEVKLFNPYRFRSLRPVDMVLDLKRINRRMHNKTFTADNQISLIGGRNMSNQYYNVSDNYQFSDVDVMLVGQAVDDIAHSFDEYWNHSYAYPVRNIVNHNKYTLRYDSLKEQLTKHYQEITVQNYLDLSNRTHDFDQWLNHNIQLDWVKAEVVKDAPDKIQAKAKKEQHLDFQMVNRLETPTEKVDLISAYFVPQKEGKEKLTELANKGGSVRVLTNSFKANDVALVHAFYAKYRKELLKNGVELYEFLPAVSEENLYANSKEISKKAKVSLKGLSRSSLHAKLMALDSKQVFIGSFNFDPRSANLNTEIGVIINSPPLANAVHKTMDDNLKKYAYKLVLDSKQNINWLKETPSGIVTLRKEPKMKWWQKAGVKMISWLPIEGFM